MQENGNQLVEPDGTNGKRLRAMQNSGAVQSMQRDGHNSDTPAMPMTRDNGLTPIQQMISMIGALLAQGERATASVELLVANIAPDMLADIVIANMSHLPATMPPIQVGEGDPVGAGGMVGVLPHNAGVPPPSPPVVPPPVQIPAMVVPAMGVPTMVVPPIVVPTIVVPPAADASTPSQNSADSRRDPRRVSNDPMQA